MTVDALTLILAILGAVTGVAALIWNFVEFRLSGPKVTVATRAGLLGSHAGQPGVVSGSANVWTTEPDRYPGFTNRVVGVEVRNRGRLPTTIDKYRVHVAGDVSYVPTQTPVGSGPPIPYRLEPHTTVNWWIDLDTVIDAQHASTQALKIKARPLLASVELGNGDVVKARNGVAVPNSLLPS